MPFLARCPTCRQKMRFSDSALGASQQCPRCHNYFTVAAEETALASAPAPQPAAIAAEDAELPGPQQTPVVVQLSLPDPVAVRPRKANLCGVLSLLLGSVGLLCASLPAVDFLTIPLTAVGLAAGVFGLAVEQGRRGRVLSALGGIVCLPVLTLALFWPAGLSPSYAWRRAPRPPDPKQFAVIPSRGDHQAELARPAEDDGLEIDEGGIRQGDVQVRVMRAFWGRHTPPTKGKKVPASVVLTVVVRVSNVGTSGKIHYDSWGVARSGVAHAPRLRDDRGRSYGLKEPGPSATLSKRFENDDLPAGTAVEDRLMFPEPAAGAGALTLELPSAAVGAQGAFKFRIARSKILANEPVHGRKP